MSKDYVRGIHVSPGIYTDEIDLTYATKSLGITTLGIAGETEKGPAFQPILIEDWNQYQNYFGGTNPEKFKGTQYPKYELPYIAKSYLTQSKQMYVTRVLGLSGYNAGPAWIISAKYADSGQTSTMVVAVIRSRGYYKKLTNLNSTDACGTPEYAYDVLKYYVNDKEDLGLGNYFNVEMNFAGCNPEAGLNEEGFDISSTNYGRFTISGTTDTGEEFYYPVSLNPFSPDYIINVIGTEQDKGDAPVYVEELYDIALRQMVDSGKVVSIKAELDYAAPIMINDKLVGAPVNDLMTRPEENGANGLNKAYNGKRYLASADSVANKITVHKFDKNNKLKENSSGTTTFIAELGHIYTVVPYTLPTSKRVYYYAEYEGKEEEVKKPTTGDTQSKSFVKVLSYDKYFCMNSDESDVAPVACDLNDYKEQYRFASTPWVVSEIKGDAKKMDLAKLFRFHTITDGNYANRQVKISISNIKPDEGIFDVAIRDFNDSDTIPTVLEVYTKCNLVPGDANYLGYKMGTFDGTYESKSQYVTVEIIENDRTMSSVPCGFLGYPVRNYKGMQPDGSTFNLDAPVLKYNTTWDEQIKNNRQYFGMSDLVGVDVDILNYKGVDVYDNESDITSYTPGFHLDSRMNSTVKRAPGETISITVDGVSGYTWETVGVDNTLPNGDLEPRIGTEEVMEGTIYEYVNLRKFTLYPCGGFDGWDIYRDSRTNTDEYKASNYKGNIDNGTGDGTNFSKILDPSALNLDENGITSDYYAYLSAIRQYSNPSTIDINVFATPGIDYINNQALVEETIDMIEQERADSFYVVTTPDKPAGASDDIEDMYTADEVVANLDGTDINSSYTATYYPWVKFLDKDNNQYINLPATKDVVRNMAMTDNTAYPWFPPAGIDRGDVECVKAHKALRLSEEDSLTAAHINPIKTFSTDGVKIWGNRNLQQDDRVSSQISVRRLMLRIRKLIAIACNPLIFEPNDPTVRSKFISLVTPILDNIRSNRGISDYKIKVDNSTEALDSRDLNAVIYLKPYNALEYINITFVLTRQGVNFDDI